MKSRLPTATAVGTVVLGADSAFGRALMVLVILLFAVLVATAVYWPDDSKREAAQEVLRILLGRPRG